MLMTRKRNKSSLLFIKIAIEVSLMRSTILVQHQNYLTAVDAPLWRTFSLINMSVCVSK